MSMERLGRKEQQKKPPGSRTTRKTAVRLLSPSHRYPLIHLAFQPLTILLEPTPLRRPRERNTIPDILLPRNPRHQPLPPHPKPPMPRRSIPPQLDIPLIRLPINPRLLHRAHELRLPMLAQRTPCQLAESRNEEVETGYGFSACGGGGVWEHVEWLERGRVVGDEDGACGV